MPMVVQHYRKIKTAVGLMNVAAHNLREKVYDADGKLIENPQLTGKWLHPEHEKLNQHTHKDAKSSILERRSEGIKLANLSRKPQKNAAHAVEAVFSFSHEFCADWATNPESKKKVDMFFTGAMHFVKEKFGAENVLQADVHYDEATPHMHVLMMPICQDAVQKKYYSSSNFLGGRAGLKELQTEFVKEVGVYFGLERGVEGSKARHTDQAEWTQKLRAKEKALNAERKAFEEQKKAFNHELYQGMNKDLQGFFSSWNIHPQDTLLFWNSVQKTLVQFKSIQEQNGANEQGQTIKKTHGTTHIAGF